MNYVLQGTAPLLKPRREEPLERSGAIPLRPDADRPSIATRPRRHPLSWIQVAWSRRRRTDSLPATSSRESASGVSPIASGASRGIALLGRH